MMQKKKKLPMSYLLHLMATEKDVRAIDRFVQQLGLKPADPSELIKTRKGRYAWLFEY
jgi:hypothetical protein